MRAILLNIFAGLEILVHKLARLTVKIKNDLVNGPLITVGFRTQVEYVADSDLFARF